MTRAGILVALVLAAAPAAAQPDRSGVVAELARTRAADLHNSCQDQGGSWAFMDAVVDRLQAEDPRWGYNAKRGNMNDPSHDAIAYYYGTGTAEGSSAVYILDIIGGHCGANPTPAWINQTEATKLAGTIGRYIGCRPGRTCGAPGTPPPPPPPPTVDLGPVLAQLETLTLRVATLAGEIAQLREAVQPPSAQLAQFEAKFDVFRADFLNYQDRLSVLGLQLGGKVGGFLGISGTAKLPPRPE